MNPAGNKMLLEMDITLSVIIPAYNEENTVHPLLDKVVNQKLPGVALEILVVNDCSTDQTETIIEEFIRKYPDKSIRLINQDRNRGKGAAIRRGIEEATGDYLVIQDADLEYDPSEYGRLLAPLRDGKADVVYGSRFMGSNPHRILFFWHSIGNRFLTFLSNMFNNLKFYSCHNYSPS